MIIRGFTTAGTGEKLTPFPCGPGGSGTDTDDQQATEVPYDNSGSGLTAVDVQEAIDELAAQIAALSATNFSEGDLLSTGEIGDTDETGTSAALAAAILALSPHAYWKLNDSGATAVDSSGNGLDLTITGTNTPNFAPLLPKDPEKYLRFGGTNAMASRAGSLGLSMPLAGDYSGICVVWPESLTTNQAKLFNMYVAGQFGSETEANNVQLQYVLNTALQGETFWENGAGTNNSTLSIAFARVNEPIFFGFTKDATAKTVTYFRNGRQVGTAAAFTNNASGGSGSITTSLGHDGTNNTNNFVMGHKAFFTKKLTAAEHYELARIAGLTGS